MILGNLLAERGASTLVLEQHKDFSREYRGEVLMPRFSQMMKQINFNDWLDTLPRVAIKNIELYFKEKRLLKVDVARVAPDAPAAFWIPQTTLLESLHEKAKAIPQFDLWFDAPVRELIKDGEKILGVQTKRGTETVEVRARVVVGADGRFSAVSKRAGFEMEYEHYRFDILWFTIPQPDGYDNTVRAMLSPGRSFLLLPKFPKHIQVGILVPPRELAVLRKEGIGKLKDDLRNAHPLFREFADSLKDFSAFHPLQAHQHMIKNWAKEGCLLIGDAAHCCSPAGAVGVSIAVGTAIVAADQISRLLKSEPGVLSQAGLSRVQALRDTEVREVHKMQRLITGGALSRVFPVGVVLPMIVALGAYLGIVRRNVRKMITQVRPLPIGR